MALFWTAEGINRVGMFGRPASFKRSTFSGRPTSCKPG